MVKKKIFEKLKHFETEHKVSFKGSLCVVLVVTGSARKKSPPYNPDDFLTSKKGQVSGLGKSAVQAILANHGIERVLAEEGGRTSRGSISIMRAYLKMLNGLHEDGMLDFEIIEEWWVDRVKNYFSSEPFKLKIDPSKSLRSIVGELIDAAFDRQRECQGTMIAGAVMQHLVGAKLRLLMPDAQIEHKGFSVADAPGGRKGDFLVGDTAIHVTTAPTEALIRKCLDNLRENIRPIIITTHSGVGGAGALAKNADADDRIDIMEVEQFISTNVYEWSRFEHAQRPTRCAIW
jgi:hypothetical protein